MVEGAPLLREYTPKAYRGFESHPLRHFVHLPESCFLFSFNSVAGSGRGADFAVLLPKIGPNLLPTRDDSAPVEAPLGTDLVRGAGSAPRRLGVPAHRHVVVAMPVEAGQKRVIARD